LWYKHKKDCGSAAMLRKGVPSRQSVALGVSCSKCIGSKVLLCTRAKRGGKLGLVVPAPLDVRRGGPESLTYWVPRGDD
jgi:hypothetical protein